MIVRRVEPKDFEALAPLIHQAVEDASKAGASILATILSKAVFAERVKSVIEGRKQGAVVLAEADGEILGWSAAEGFDFDMSWGRTATGLMTWVDESHRGNGVANSLKRELHRILADEGFAALTGVVDLQNREAMRSAVLSGFEPMQLLGVKNLEDLS